MYIDTSYIKKYDNAILFSDTIYNSPHAIKGQIELQKRFIPANCNTESELADYTAFINGGFFNNFYKTFIDRGLGLITNHKVKITLPKDLEYFSNIGTQCQDGFLGLRQRCCQEQMIRGGYILVTNVDEQGKLFITEYNIDRLVLSDLYDHWILIDITEPIFDFTTKSYTIPSERKLLFLSSFDCYRTKELYESEWTTFNFYDATPFLYKGNMLYNRGWDIVNAQTLGTQHLTPPPFLELADATLQYFKLSCQHHFILGLVANPIPYSVNILDVNDTNPVKLGSSTFIKAQVDDGMSYELGYAEINGSGIDEINVAMEKIEKFSENYLSNLNIVGNQSGLAWELFINLQTSVLHSIENVFIKAYENQIQNAIMLSQGITETEQAEKLFSVDVAESFISSSETSNTNPNDIDNSKGGNNAGTESESESE